MYSKNQTYYIKLFTATNSTKRICTNCLRERWSISWRRTTLALRYTIVCVFFRWNVALYKCCYRIFRSYFPQRVNQLTGFCTSEEKVLSNTRDRENGMQYLLVYRADTHTSHHLNYYCFNRTLLEWRYTMYTILTYTIIQRLYGNRAKNWF